MKREIKFRVWDEDNNTIGTVLSFTNLENLRHDLDGIEDYFGRGYFKDNPNYLMQYTGLKDKNGVEIYEGDIIKYYNRVGVVRFRKGQFEIYSGDDGYILSLFSIYKDKKKVIGNIHE